MRSSVSTWASAWGWNACRTPYSPCRTRPSSEWPSRGRPLLGCELGRFEEFAGVEVGVHRGQGDQVGGVHRGEQCGDLAALGQGLGQGVSAAVQVGAGGGAGEGEAAAAEFVAQLFGGGGQVAEGPELDGGVAGGGGFVEEAVPGAPAGGRRGTRRPRSPGQFPAADWSGWVPSARTPRSCGRWSCRSLSSEDGDEVGCGEVAGRSGGAGAARRWPCGPARPLSGCCSRRSPRSRRCSRRPRTTGR
jgi:hypothetical protein